MTREPTPVILPDGSALLPDGRHVPKADIDRAVRLIENCCNLLAEWQAAVVAEAEAAVREG